MYKPQFPVVGARRTITGEATPVLHEGEKHEIVDMYIKLKEVPQFISGQQNVLIPGYTEVFTDPQIHEFRVNYATGRVFFHTSQEGGSVSVSYNGLGSLTAVDEINWLWEQLLAHKTLVGLFDTPNDYEGYPNQYLRVNGSRTGIEFVPPSIGRSLATYEMRYIAAGASVELDAGTHDVISFYEMQPAESIGTTFDSDNWVIDGNIGTVSFAPPVPIDDPDAPEAPGTVNEGFGITSGVPGETASMHNIDMGSFTGWNAIDKIEVSVECDGDAVAKVLIIINSIPHTWDGARFVPVSDVETATILSAGMDYNTLSMLPAAAFDRFIGEHVGIAMGMQNGTSGASPVWNGFLKAVGKTGGGYTQTDACEAHIDMQLRRWTITNTSLEGKDFVIVLGTGRDDICCTSDAVQFDNVDMGAPVYFNAPAQSFLQIYVFETLEPIAARKTDALSDWSPLLPADSVTHAAGTTFAVQQSADGKAALNNINGVESVLSFKDGLLIDDTGNVAPVTVGDMFLHAAFTGYGMCLKEKAGIKLADSFTINAGTSYPNWQANYAKTVWANRAIGGLFRWVSGEPMIIGESADTPYYSGYGNTSLCAARLYSDRVRFYAAGKSVDFMYTPGSWVYVAMDYMYSYWYYRAPVSGNGSFRTRKHYARLCVNGEYKGLSMERTLMHDNPSTAYADLLCPGSIGNYINQFEWDGSFLCDMAFHSGANDISAANTEVMSLIQNARKAVELVEPELRYAALDAIDVGDGQMIRSITAEHGNIVLESERFFIESDGIWYAYDPNTDAFNTYNQSQAYDTLYNGGMTPTGLGNVPEWRFEEIRSDDMRLIQISKPGVFTEFTPDNPAYTLVGSVSTHTNINTEPRYRAWKMLRPGVDYSAEWIAEDKTWRVTSLLTGSNTLRVIASGVEAKEAIGGLTSFTELVDGPDTLNFEEHKILTGKGGKVQTLPYLNPLMTTGV